MRILVTGRDGFIARHLVQKLQNENHTVVSTGRCDDVFRELDSFLPEMIVHLGAELKDESKMFESNVMLTLKILEWVRNHPSVKLILFGTSSEYGHLNKPRHESDCPQPRTIYEGTKAATTMLAQAWATTYNLKVLFVRPFTVYGADEKPYKLSQILFRKWKDGTTLKLSDGMHDYVYIDDFLEVLTTLMFRDFPTFEIVNIGSGVQRSNYEFVRIFQKVTGYVFPIELGESKDPSMWVCDVSNRNFHIPSLESGVERMVSEYLKQKG
jgi:nucleoside-diphosphate-sugar epimerase